MDNNDDLQTFRLNGKLNLIMMTGHLKVYLNIVDSELQIYNVLPKLNRYLLLLLKMYSQTTSNISQHGAKAPFYFLGTYFFGYKSLILGCVITDQSQSNLRAGCWWTSSNDI